MAYRVAAGARGQIIRILAVSSYHYGEHHAENYRLLIEMAMQDVAAHPDRPGAQSLRRFRGIWCYEIRHSRNRVPRENRIRKPWHKLIYTMAADGTVEILAIVGRPYPSVRAAREGLAGRHQAC